MVQLPAAESTQLLMANAVLQPVAVANQPSVAIVNQLPIAKAYWPFARGSGYVARYRCLACTGSEYVGEVVKVGWRSHYCDPTDQGFNGPISWTTNPSNNTYSLKRCLYTSIYRILSISLAISFTGEVTGSMHCSSCGACYCCWR